MKEAFLLSDDELLNQIPKYLNKFQFLNAFRFSSFALDIVDTLFKPEMNKNQVIKNMLDDLPKELR